MRDEQAFDEPLPWLAPVEDEDEPRGFSGRRMLTALVVVLFAVLIIAGTFFWLGHRDSAAVNGAPELIKAPPAPYKVKPPSAGGLDISSESQTAFETSAGEDKDAKLDLNKLPETAVAKPPKAQPKAQAASTAASTQATNTAPEERAVAEAKPAGGAGSVVQLGAFANQAQAERAWTALSTRFASVGALSKMIVPFSGGIRLRAGAASPADARQVCQTLKAAGENCFVAQ